MQIEDIKNYKTTTALELEVKDIILDELKEENQNLAYENKRMAEFLEFIGVREGDISDRIINGDKKDWGLIFEYLIGGEAE